jgi:hypothetical protein
MIMGFARRLLGIENADARRSWMLRAAACAIAVHGIWSSFVLGIAAKLSMQMTLEWWDFDASASGFFRHGIAVAGLYIFLTHYFMKWTERRQRTVQAHHGLL